ncbi:MAG: hypothetical protein ACKO9D_04260, partial [Gammaproteobacteria bacterium]
MSHRPRLVTVLVALAAVGVGLSASPVRAATPANAAASPAPQRITSVEGITEYRLANGLTVLL